MKGGSGRLAGTGLCQGTLGWTTGEGLGSSWIRSINTNSNPNSGDQMNPFKNPKKSKGVESRSQGQHS